MSAVTHVALFEPDGRDVFVPTAAAQGPWSADFLHGGAVSALMTSLLERDDQVLSRVIIELLGPVPFGPLKADLGPTEGGRRVVRQTVELRAGGRPVVRASSLRMRRADLDLPPTATEHRVTFDPQAAPDLSEPNRRAIETVGRESFDSLAVAVHTDHDHRPPGGRVRIWLRLLLPVVAGRSSTPASRVVAVADNAVVPSARLDFRRWTFMNADLLVSLARPPVGDWVGLECDGYLSTTGTAQSVATIHDAGGPLGQCSQSIIIEPRTR